MSMNLKGCVSMNIKGVTVETLILLERRLKFMLLHSEFPGRKTKYWGRKRRWEEEALIDVSETGDVDVFSAEEVQEVHWELAFWVMKALYAHYRDEEPALTWEEFLRLTQGRDEIRQGAAFVARFFPEISRPDLTMWENWCPYIPVDGEDYAREKTLFKQTVALPLIVPTEYLEEGAGAMASHLAISLYISKRKHPLYSQMTWEEFREKVEAEPILRQILSHQVGWMYALHIETLRMLWKSERVTIPPLRIS